jgi:hypothetical protein
VAARGKKKRRSRRWMMYRAKVSISNAVTPQFLKVTFLHSLKVEFMEQVNN